MNLTWFGQWDKRNMQKKTNAKLFHTYAYFWLNIHILYLKWVVLTLCWNTVATQRLLFLASLFLLSNQSASALCSGSCTCYSGLKVLLLGWTQRTLNSCFPPLDETSTSSRVLRGRCHLASRSASIHPPGVWSQTSLWTDPLLVFLKDETTARLKLLIKIWPNFIQLVCSQSPRTQQIWNLWSHLNTFTHTYKMYPTKHLGIEHF